MNTEYLVKLNELKEQPINEMLLIGININEIINICTAWVGSKMQINSESFNGENLWDCTSLDFEHFLELVGPFNISTFVKLIHANILYPDGSYAHDWMHKYHSKALAEVSLGKLQKGVKL